jgi:antitoxin component of MazEF toxin-antitoxin module
MFLLSLTAPCQVCTVSLQAGLNTYKALASVAFGFQKSLAFSRGSRTINPERGSIMSRERITAVGESAALLLPKEVLDKLGIAIGDEVELSLIDRTLLLQPLDEANRAQQLVVITKAVFARRQRAYTQLAQGPE